MVSPDEIAQISMQEICKFSPQTIFSISSMRGNEEE